MYISSIAHVLWPCLIVVATSTSECEFGAVDSAPTMSPGNCKHINVNGRTAAGTITVSVEYMERKRGMESDVATIISPPVPFGAALQ